MSTPRYLKEARKKQHAEAKRAKQREELFNVRSTRTSEFKEYRSNDVYRRSTDVVNSLNSVVHETSKNESLKYTGTLIKGIATMHKSNAVPVINDEEAKDISKMRRN
jgi:hypothetical protein